jgi:hypothetical protein
MVLRVFVRPPPPDIFGAVLKKPYGCGQFCPRPAFSHGGPCRSWFSTVQLVSTRPATAVGVYIEAAAALQGAEGHGWGYCLRDRLPIS